MDVTLRVAHLPWARRVGAYTVAVLAVMALGTGPRRAVADPGSAPDADARSHVTAGEAHLSRKELDDAWTEAVLACETEPEMLDALDLASRVAEAAGRADEALWYADRALVVALRDGLGGTDLDARAHRADALDPLAAGDRADLASYGQGLLDVGKELVKRHLYANAVECLSRCRGTMVDGDADALLEHLYHDDHVVAALLDTGLDVPLDDSESRLARRKRREDPKHADWAEAWQLKGRNYTVRTDLSFKDASEIASAMEQIHDYYCRVFLGKPGASKTARCEIDVYRTQAEFLAHEPDGGDALGFFVPGENRVATYDPRSEGRPYADMWETLFHESAHQFVHMICTGLVPSWLNEGTATYFEGARRLPLGRVEANLVPAERLQDLLGEMGKGDPSLEQVLSYADAASYPAEYYPVGWGVVYFLKNYEDEKGNRPYEALYEACVKAYKATRREDPLSTFQRVVLGPMHEDLGDFQKRWQAWIHDLGALASASPEQASVLLERAREQRALGHLDAALESLRWARRKRPAFLGTELELAELHGQRREKDASLYWYRTALAEIERSPDLGAPCPGVEGKKLGEVAEACRRAIQALDPALLEAISTTKKTFVDRVHRTAGLYVDRGFPRTALFTLGAASRLLGGDPDLEELSHDLRAKTHADAFAWRRIPLGSGLLSWWPSGEWRADEAAASVSSEESARLLLREAPELPYRLEATVRLRPMSTRGFVGLAVGDDGTGVVDAFGVQAGGKLEGLRVLDLLTRREDLGDQGLDLEKGVRLAVEVDSRHVSLFVDGRAVGRLPYAPGELAGAAGLFVESGWAEVRDVRLGTP